jgi:peptidoglycan/LPS O-acetylase OafA/YrhL
VIFFTPKRWLNLVLLAVMLAGPMSRAIILALRESRLDIIYTPLPCCLDFFAIGGAVAWGHQLGWLDRVATLLRLRLLLVPATAWLLYGVVLKSTGGVFPAYWGVFDPLIQAAGFAVLIIYMLRNPDGFTARCLSSPTLVYLGGISYGIYIYHNFMHWFGPSFLRHTTGYSYMPNEFLHVLYYSVLAVAIAAASHRFLEEPLRRWGRRFG